MALSSVVVALKHAAVDDLVEVSVGTFFQTNIPWGLDGSRTELRFQFSRLDLHLLGGEI